MTRLEMKTEDIDIEAAIMSTLSSGKMDKYEYLTGVEIWTCNQR